MKRLLKFYSSLSLIHYKVAKTSYRHDFIYRKNVQRHLFMLNNDATTYMLNNVALTFLMTVATVIGVINFVNEIKI